MVANLSDSQLPLLFNSLANNMVVWDQLRNSHGSLTNIEQQLLQKKDKPSELHDAHVHVFYAEKRRDMPLI